MSTLYRTSQDYSNDLKGVESQFATLQAYETQTTRLAMSEIVFASLNKSKIIPLFHIVDCQVSVIDPS